MQEPVLILLGFNYVIFSGATRLVIRCTLRLLEFMQIRVSCLLHSAKIADFGIRPSTSEPISARTQSSEPISARTQSIEGFLRKYLANWYDISFLLCFDSLASI